MHPIRKRIRLKGYDYSKDGQYFVTSNIRKYSFGKIVNGSMMLNELGKIVNQQWQWLADQYPYLILCEFIIMPDHLHGIIEIDSARAGHDPGAGHDRPLQRKIKPVPEIMGALKMTISKRIHLAGYQDFKWHRSFHDRIIRNSKEYSGIEQYIRNNPGKWNSHTGTGRSLLAP